MVWIGKPALQPNVFAVPVSESNAGPSVVPPPPGLPLVPLLEAPLVPLLEPLLLAPPSPTPVPPPDPPDEHAATKTSKRAQERIISGIAHDSLE